MIIGLKPQADGSIMIWGESDDVEGAGRAHFLNEIAPGDSFCGLSYDELLQYAYIETGTDGGFIGGSKRTPVDPSRPAEIPPFLRRQP